MRPTGLAFAIAVVIAATVRAEPPTTLVASSDDGALLEAPIPVDRSLGVPPSPADEYVTGAN